MRPNVLPLAILSAVPLFTGGALHLRDWLRTYRAVPWEVPGAWVVRVGFPLTTATSFVLGAALVAAAAWRWERIRLLVPAALLFQASSIAALILSRRGSVFGWTEPVWSLEARQILAVEILTVIGLVATALATHSPIRHAGRLRTSS